jgi:Dyp-type peroxidase family
MALDFSTIQSIVLRKYQFGDGFPYAYYAFLVFADGSQPAAWLGALRPHLTSCADLDADHDRPMLSLGLSYRGVTKLGKTESFVDDWKRCKPYYEGLHAPTTMTAFQEGMRCRQHILGDAHLPRNLEYKRCPERPFQGSTWEAPWTDQDFDAIVAIYGEHPSDVDRLVATLQGTLVAGVTIAHFERGGALPEAPRYTEHFGYVDGISQPAVAGSGAPRDHRGDGTPDWKSFDKYAVLHPEDWRSLRAGDFVIGHLDETDRTCYAEDPFTLNGSFLVFRKLEQDVPLFDRKLREWAGIGESEDVCRMGELEMERIAGKLVGRSRGGDPLVPGGGGSDRNDFGFRMDPHGVYCPAGAHIRRANPRDDPAGPNEAQVTQHRVIRRGHPYGPKWEKGVNDNTKRGLLFVAINADINRQFEYIQMNWMNGSLSSSKLTVPDDADPLVGNNEPGHSKFLIPEDKPHLLKTKMPTICWDLPSFVTARGGEYFFVPSLAAVDAVVASEPAPAPAPAPAENAPEGGAPPVEGGPAPAQ